MRPKTHECDNALGALIASTKRRSRSLDLVQIAEELRTAIECFGSIEAVAEKIGLSRSMLRRFQYVERLTKPLQSLVKARKIDSIDAVAELSSLTEADQNKLAQVLEKAGFSTEDIRGFVRFSNKHPEMSFEEILSRVQGSKTRHLYIYEFVARDNMREPGKVGQNVAKLLNSEEFDSVDTSSVVGRLKVSKAGRKRITEEAKTRKLSISNFVQQLCEGELI
jgi:hypothetical protein